MSDVSRNPGGDRPIDFKGFLNKMHDWDDSFKEEGRRSKIQALKGKKSESLLNAGMVDEDKGSPIKLPAIGTKENIITVPEVTPKNYDELYNFLRHSDALGQTSSSDSKDKRSSEAVSEKELGNEYFKHKKFREAIECYSRSIVLSPTAVAFANRAMAYLKFKRFEEAEDDCTEALNLDDRYVKAYSRRATARKELGKLKESMEDSEFSMRLEPNNQELRKQYAETKALYDKEIAMKTFGASRTSIPGIQRVGHSDMQPKDDNGVQFVSSNKQKETVNAVQTNSVLSATRNCLIDSSSRCRSLVFMDNNGKISGQPLIAVKDIDNRIMDAGVGTRELLLDGSQGVATKHLKIDYKHNLNASIEDIASRAASRIMATTAKNMTAPKSAYEFEVSWRALSDDPKLQVNFLKTIPPVTLPGIFKNALYAPMLVDIVRCTATLFKDDSELAVSIIDNLAKVPRFDMIVMCLSAADRSGFRRIWDEVLSVKDIPVDQADTLSRLRPRYLSL